MADTKFSALPLIDALALEDETAVVDASDITVSKKATEQQRVDLLNASALLDTGALVNEAVTAAKQSNISQNIIIGRVTAGAGSREELTPAQVRTLLNVGDGADVKGPAVAVDGNIAVYDQTTGKIIKDSGFAPSDFGDVSGPGSAVNENIAVYDQITGKLIKDSGVNISVITPIVNTKGDLETYDTVPVRLPVGADGQRLTADSGEATGLKWETPSGGVSI